MFIATATWEEKGMEQTSHYVSSFTQSCGNKHDIIGNKFYPYYKWLTFVTISMNISLRLMSKIFISILQ